VSGVGQGLLNPSLSTRLGIAVAAGVDAMNIMIPTGGDNPHGMSPIGSSGSASNEPQPYANGHANGAARPPLSSAASTTWTSPLRARAALAGLQLDLNVNLGPDLNYPYPLSPPTCEPKTPPDGPCPPLPPGDHVAAGALQSLENLWMGLSSSTPAARVRCAHEIAQLLASTQQVPALLPHVRNFCSTRLNISQLTDILDGRSDILKEQLVLSVITNLSFVGITEQLVLTPSVPPLVVRALLASAENHMMRDYALPAAYNLSSEPRMLQALLEAGDPVVTVLLGWAKAADAQSARFAQHTLGNISRFRAAEQQRKKLSRPHSAPPLSNRFRKLSGRFDMRKQMDHRRNKFAGCWCANAATRSESLCSLDLHA